MDIVDAKLQVGMIGTPFIGFIDKQSDYRWIEQNYVDQAKTVLVASIDNSSDMGISLDLSFMKMIKATAVLVNGEGYKKVNESDLGDDGKAHYGLQG